MRARHRLQRQLFLDNWPIRRRWLRRGLLWLALNIQSIIVLTVFGYIDALLRDMAIAMLAAFVSMFSAYVFGSYLDDKDKRDRLHDAFDDDGAGDDATALKGEG